MIKFNKTGRGFSRGEFTDRNGVSCSIQMSSLATEACIWLGCNEIGLQRLEPGKGGWVDVPTPSEGPGGVNHIANTRMHLNREQVAALLPILQHFVSTGEIDGEVAAEPR